MVNQFLQECQDNPTGKERSSQQMVLRHLDIHKQRKNLHIYLTPYPKINSKEIIDLNVWARTIKLLEKSIGVNICGLGLCNSFLDMTPKAQAMRVKLHFISCFDAHFFFFFQCLWTFSKNLI